LELKRLCHTWKGRNAQIGFRKCSWLANDLHNFLRDVLGGGLLGNVEDLLADDAGRGMIAQQAEAFLERIARECEAIRAFLVRQNLVAD
jgi:hypothetical protein